MQALNQEVLNENYCLRDFRFQLTTSSQGMETCDGILGLSPRHAGRHSLLIELKVSGLIDKAMVSFNNAFYKGTPLLYKSGHGTDSNVIFGGFNESQIMNGAQGLLNLPLAPERLNPMAFWGVEGRGFAYGDTLIMDPSKYKDPILTVIDSGTTLVIIPQDLYETLIEVWAEQFRADKNVSLICTRVKDVGQARMCYFS